MKTAIQKLSSLLLFLLILLTLALSATAQSYGEFVNNPFFHVPSDTVLVGKTFREILTIIDAVPPSPTEIARVEGEKRIMADDYFVMDTTTWEDVRTYHCWNKYDEAASFRIDDVCNEEIRALKTIDMVQVIAYVERLGFKKQGELVKTQTKGGLGTATVLSGYVIEGDAYQVNLHIVEYHDTERFGWTFLQMAAIAH